MCLPLPSHSLPELLLSLSQLSFYSCDKTPWPKSTLGGKGRISLHIYIAVHHWRKSGQELKQVWKLEAGADAKAGADAEATEGCCLLVCFMWLTLDSFKKKDLFIYLFIYYVHSVLPALQKRASDLIIDVSHHVGAGNRTRDLWKNNQCSQPLSHLSSPYRIFYL